MNKIKVIIRNNNKVIYNSTTEYKFDNEEMIKIFKAYISCLEQTHKAFYGNDYIIYTPNEELNDCSYSWSIGDRAEKNTSYVALI